MYVHRVIPLLVYNHFNIRLRWTANFRIENKSPENLSLWSLLLPLPDHCGLRTKSGIKQTLDFALGCNVILPK